MTQIKLKNVSARDKSGAELRNVDLTINEGEYIAVLGPTGSGPSEVLKVVAGLLEVTNGGVFFDDQNVTELPPEDRNISMVFEQFNLFPHLSVLDNLLFGPRMRQANISEKLNVAEEVISMVRLDGREDAISRELSGGMQQRVGVARAIVAGADILLLDQPYRALDAKIRAEMRIEIRNIVKGLKLSCIHSTHETEEAMIVADRIAIFHEGKLEQIGTPREVFDSPKTEFVASFLAESNVWDIEMVKGKLKIQDNILINYDKSKYPVSNYSKLVIRQHAIDLFFDDKIPKSWNTLDGIITKVRLLGEFIRISVDVNNTVFIVRDLLNPDLRNPMELVGKDVKIAFPIDDVRLF